MFHFINVITIFNAGGALIASALLKSLAQVAEKDVEMDLANDLSAHAV